MINPLLQLLKEDRFVEVLYYGGIEATQSDSAETQLMLGLACCSAIRPLANILRRQNGEDSPIEGYAISRKTKIVGHGYRHLENALLLNPNIVIPNAIFEFCQVLRQDLIVYVSQDFQFSNDFDGQFTLAEAAWGSIVILDRMGVPASQTTYRDFYLYRWGIGFVEKRLTNRMGRVDGRK